MKVIVRFQTRLALLMLLIVTALVAQNSNRPKLAPSYKSIIKPNIILIVSDDAGYKDFGSYGAKDIPTPNINSIAAKGVKFTDAYVTASVCAPSRAGLLTGRYQQRFGFEFNMTGKPTEGYLKTDMGMDPQERTIANEMQANGYKTIALGKWHQGFEEKHYPLKRGFDEFYGFVGGNRNFFSNPNSKVGGQTLMDNNTPVPEKEITYLTDMLTNKATSFIKQNKEQPFFMYLAYNAVPVPMQAKKEMMDRFASIPNSGRRTYAAMMASLDEGVGKVLATLKENKLDNNTIVIFLNDNGGPKVNSSDNGPLHGNKGSVWEGGIRVAFMMKWPGNIPENTVYKNPVSALDILPTSLAASVGKREGNKKLDGVNLLPYLNKKTASLPHDILFWRRGEGHAVRAGKWKLIKVKAEPILLFDLDKDISETTNLANKYPDVVKNLLSKLNAWEKELSAPHWTETVED